MAAPAGTPVSPGTDRRATIADVATGHLIALGHRRIGFIGDMPFSLSTVRQPLALSGAERARRLCGEKVLPLQQELPIEPMARNSSAQRVSG